MRLSLARAGLFPLPPPRAGSRAESSRGKPRQFCLRGYGNPRRRPDDARLVVADPSAPTIPSGTPRFGAPKERKRRYGGAHLVLAPRARSPSHLRAVASPPSVVVDRSRGATSSRPSRARPRLASPVPKIAPSRLSPLLLRRAVLGRRTRASSLASPTASTPSGARPTPWAGSDSSSNTPSPDSAFSRRRRPRGGFAEREPPNYSFGVGSPGAVALVSPSAAPAPWSRARLRSSWVPPGRRFRSLASSGICAPARFLPRRQRLPRGASRAPAGAHPDRAAVHRLCG